MRLIDADELKSVFAEKSTEAVCGTDLCKAIISRIDDTPTVDIPTVGESVGVIRCKDCRFSGADATCCLVCKREGMGLKPFHVYHDDFCSYAERKEE